MRVFRILWLLVRKRKTLFGLFKEINDVITAIRNIKDVESNGGTEVTKEEMLKTLYEVEDVLTKLKELI